MPISTSTVFHFTNSPDHLISILTSNFLPHFCLEDLTVVMPDLSHKEDLEFALPMVCFCDIPLSQISPHLAHYGNYGIGLTKTWAIQNGLAPVLYLLRGSPLASIFYSIGEQLGTLPHDKIGNSPAMDHFHDLSAYIKPYEGVSVKDPKDGTWRFYDEREWRFVPDLTDLPFRYGLTKDEMLDQSTRDRAHRVLWQRSVLKFEPNDIKYIIVEREDEILAMISRIGRIKRRFPSANIDLLASRVISSMQIREDF